MSTSSTVKTVYQIHCEKCNNEYVGETARSLEIRVKEHQSRNSSAIYEHCRLEGHSVDPNKTKVSSTEINTFKRRIKEAIQIKLTKPALNRDNGYELAANPQEALKLLLKFIFLTFISLTDEVRLKKRTKYFISFNF